MLNVQPEPGVVAAHVGAAYELAAPVTATLLRRGFNDTFRGRVTLFDFDHGGYGWRIWDVATALGDLTGPRRSALLAGYEAVRPLADAERGALPVFRALRPLWDRGDILAMRTAWGTEDDAPTDESTEWLLRALQQSRRQFLED